MPLVAAAVNRVSGSGKVIGPHQRISPYLAIKAVTAWAAFQIKEEKTKGTLQAGKLADLVILEKNPLKIAPQEISGIKVMETIKEGKSIFKFSNPVAMNLQLASDEHHAMSSNKKPLTAHQQKLLVNLIERAK
jgi:adenine deaminase